MNQKTTFLNTLQDLLGEDINVSLLLSSFKKSIIWILIIFTISVTTVFLYLRYTLPVYQASASIILKPDFSTSQLLGVNNVFAPAVEDQNRELQFIKSRILIERVVGKLPLEVNYYAEGRTKLIIAQLYKEAPFNVRIIKVKDDFIYDRDITFNFIDKNRFEIKYFKDEKSISESFFFGKPFETPHFDIEINIEPIAQENFQWYKDNNYYFRINNMGNLINGIAADIELMPLDSRTTQVTYRNKNKTLAADILNVTINEFRQLNRERKSESAEQIMHFLTLKLDTFKRDYNELQDSLKNFRIKNQYIDPESQLARLLTKMFELEDQKNELTLQMKIHKWISNYIDSVKDVRLLSAGLVESNLSGSAGSITDLKSIQNSQEELMLGYTEEHPRIKLNNREISRAKNEMKTNLSGNKERIDFKVSNNTELLNKYSGELFSLPEKEAEYNRIMRNYNLLEKYYLMMVDKLAEYSIAKEGIVSDYSILEKAAIPSEPISPKKVQLWTGAVIATIILGLLLIVARYFLHTTIISVNEIKNKTKAVFLGTIPTIKEVGPGQIILVNKNPKSLISEALRGIRANMQFINNQPGSKLVAVTSSISGEGKTFTSLNLSGILGLLEKKVIILDFDMRRPRLNKIFNIPNEKGVSTILIGKHTIDECIHNTEIENLCYVTSGPIPPNPAELILSNNMRNLLNDLKKKFDYVVIDTPPIGLVTDGIEIIKMADFPIYVFRADYSDRAFISNLDRLINENKIHNLAFVLNDIGRGVSGYYYDKSYSYSYSYGYGYGTGYYTEETSKITKDTLVVKLLKKIFN
jgi:tyrosine-protein kinase Etk/Wzc